MNTLNTAKVYASHVTAQDMSIIGWTKDFDVEQTLEEMTNMGVDITKEQLELHWSRLTESFASKFCSCCGEVTLTPIELLEPAVCDDCFNEQVITK